MKRRFFSVLLSICLLVSMFPAAVHAEGGSILDYMQLETTTYYYTGSPVVLDLEWIAGKILEEGVDYEVLYEDWEGQPLESAPVELGSYWVTILGKGAYYGEMNRWFEIITEKDLRFTYLDFNPRTYIYTGEPVVLELELWLDDVLLIEDLDYRILYRDDEGVLLTDAPVAVGNYSIDIEGINQYSGRLSGYDFEIVSDKDLSLADFSIYPTAYLETGEAVVLVTQVRLEGQILVPGQDYGILYYDEYFDELPLPPSEAGSYFARAIGQGSYTGRTYYHNFSIVTANNMEFAVIDFGQTRYPHTGDPVILDLTVRLDGQLLIQGKDYLIEYRGEDWTLLTEVPSEIGRYSFRVNGIGDYEGSAFGGWFEIYSDKDLASAVYDLGQYLYIYTGEPVLLDFSVSIDGVVLSEGSEYKINYFDEEGQLLDSAPALPGAYSFEVEGISPYYGTVSDFGFVIAAENDLVRAEIRWFQYSYPYTGQPVELDLEVWMDGQELTEGLDYEIFYRDEYAEDMDAAPIEIGEYSFFIQGRGAYIGTQYGYIFEIASPYDLIFADISFSTYEYKATGSPVELDLDVRLQGELLVQGRDYRIIYYDDNWNLLPAAPGAEGYYSFMLEGIEPYIGMVGYWDFSIVDGSDLHFADVYYNQSRYYYTGHPVDLDLEIRMDGTLLVEGQDYQLQYWDDDWNLLDYVPVEVGHYSWEAVGIGSYSGQTYGYWFEIVNPNDLRFAYIEFYERDYVYTGNPVALEIEVRMEGRQLVRGIDYQLVYYDEEGELLAAAPIESGSYYVEIQGAGIYVGSAHGGMFHILPSNHIRFAETDLAEHVLAYTGEPVSLDLSVRMGNKVLVENVDYQLHYFDQEDNPLAGSPVEIGSYYFDIEGIGDYSGVRGGYWFDIVASNDLRLARVLLHKDELIYTGQPVLLDLTVLMNEVELVENEDFLLHYFTGDNEALPGAPAEIGSYYFELSGQGAYTGRRYGAWFTILAANDLWLAEVDLYRYHYIWTGEAVVLDMSVRMNGQELVKDLDYELRFFDDRWEPIASAPSAIGAYFVEIEGRGDYTGRSSYGQWFEIVAVNDLKLADVSYYQRYYRPTGQPVQLDLQVEMNGRSLIEGQDYQVNYYLEGWVPLAAAPADIGFYYFDITGIGAYTGEAFRDWFEIIPENDLTLADIELGQYHYRETGAPVILDLTVRLGGLSLLEGQDYKLNYFDDQLRPLAAAPAEKGQYYFEIEGIGSYIGTSGLEWFFILSSNDLQLHDYLAWTDYYLYTGEPVILELTIELDGVELVQGRDYQINYFDANWTPLASAPSALGQYFFSIQGMGSYSGILEALSFSIVTMKDLVFAELFLHQNLYAYTGQPIQVEASVFMDRLRLHPDIDYKLEFWDVNTWYPLPGLPSAVGEYLVMAVGMGDYSGSSYRQSIKIVPDKDLDLAEISLFRSSYIETGQPVVLDLSVRMNGELLSEGTDYKLIYWDGGHEQRLETAPSAPGSYLFYITGMGPYTGEQSRSFRITVDYADNDIGSGSLVLGSYIYYYTGQPVLPDMTLYFGYGILTRDVDYTISYRSMDSGELLAAPPVEAGFYEVIATGTGHYTGQLTAIFWVAPANDLGEAEMDLINGDVFTYTGQPVDPGLRVTLFGTLLTEGEDYIILYKDSYERVTASAPTEPGFYRIQIKGIGDYRGNNGTRFNIYSVNDLGLADISLSAGNGYYYPYTGLPVDPGLTVKMGNKLLVEGVDYIVIFGHPEAGFMGLSLPVSIGDHTIRIEGRGAYTGYAYAYMYITAPTSLAAAVLTLSGDYFVYDGTAKSPALTLVLGGVTLREGRDFELRYTDLATGILLESAPVEKGRYMVQAWGLEPFIGATAGFFVIGTFKDITPDHWAYDFVEELYAMGIIGGYGKTGEFRPANLLNRQETAKMVASGAGLQASAGFVTSFSDVSPDGKDGWAYEFITALEEAEVVSGFGKTNQFRPLLSIKRNHVAKIAVLAFGLEEGNVDYHLSDIDGVDCEEHIRILASNGIVSGYGTKQEFRPDREISRAEFAKIITLAMQLGG